MKNLLKYGMVLVFLVVLALGVVTPALADNAPASEVQDGMIWGDGINGGFVHNTFHAVGRDWIVYVLDDGAHNDILIRSSANHGTSWEGAILVDNAQTVFRQLAVWYNPAMNRASYVRAEYVDPNYTIRYREFTPNADGTATWIAAEQTVDASSGNIGSVAHCVDEYGFPWAAWTENIGDGNYTPMAEASSVVSGSTGLWAEQVGTHKENFCNMTAQHMTSLIISATPVAVEPNYRVQIAWSLLTTDPADPLAGIWACFANMTAWSPLETVVGVAASGLTPTVYASTAFSFYDHGASIIGVYTDFTGDVYRRWRSMDNTWDTAPVAQLLVADQCLPDHFWFPAVAGYDYNAPDAGETLIVLLNNNASIYYMMRHGATNVWDVVPTRIWDMPPTGILILFHSMQYRFSSPVGFAWEWGDVEFGPNGWIEDILQYWWMDSDGALVGESDVGWYAHVSVPGVIEGVNVGTGLIAMIYVIIFAMVAIILFFVWATLAEASLTLAIILSAIIIIAGLGLVTLVLNMIASW